MDPQVRIVLIGFFKEENCLFSLLPPEIMYKILKPLRRPLVEILPEKPWYWNKAGIPSNPALTPELSEKYKISRFILPSIQSPKSLDPAIKTFAGVFEVVEKSTEPDSTDGTLRYLENHPTFKRDWGFSGLSSNPNVTSQFVEKHIDKPWNWTRCGLASNPKVATRRFILRYSDKPWDWRYLSRCRVALEV